jgi:heme-degrading monooxygenase HmoA
MEAVMFLEIALIDIKPGQEAEFEAGVAKAAPYFKRAKGCKSLSLQRSVEKPSRYRLFIGWDTVENHTDDFRGSADFQEWRKLVAYTFAGVPEVEHVREVVKAF